jgi:hypothetical protein
MLHKENKMGESKIQNSSQSPDNLLEKICQNKIQTGVNYVTERVTPLRLHRSRQRARLRRRDYGVCPSGVNISARDGGGGGHTRAGIDSPP